MPRLQTGKQPGAKFPMTQPGAILREMIEAEDLSVAEFSKRLGVTRKAVYDVVSGKSAITADMALKLERVLGASAEFWLNLQVQYDLWHARNRSPKASAPRRRAA